MPTLTTKAKSLSAAMLVLGTAFLFLAPIGGVLLLVSGRLGLAIASDAAIDGSSPDPSTTTDSKILHQASSSTSH